MPSKTIFIGVDNYRYAQEKDEGVGRYINSLIEKDRGGAVFESKPMEVGVPTENKKIIKKVVVDNIFACKECGNLKSAGRCITPGCKRKGKL